MLCPLLNSGNTRFFIAILFLSFVTPAMAAWQDVLEDLQKDIQQGATEAVREIGDVVTGTKKPAASPQANEKTSSPSTAQYKTGSTSMFERMTVQFLMANADKIQPEVAAALYGYAVKDYNAKEDNECRQIEKIGNSIEARAALKILHAEMRTLLNTNLEKYKNHEYTVSLGSSPNVKDYDHGRSALIIEHWNNLSYSVDAYNKRSQRKFTPCNAMLDLPRKAQVSLMNPLPRVFGYRFNEVLVALYTGPNVASKIMFFESDKLKFVPMSSDKALTFLKRGRLDKGLAVKVTFKYKPIGFEYWNVDDKSSITGKFDVKTILKSISYFDKKTGEQIYRLGINDHSFTCESAYQHGGGLVKCPSTAKASVKTKAPATVDSSSKANQSKNTSVKTLATEIQLSNDAKKAREQCLNSGYRKTYDCDCIAKRFDRKSTEETRDIRDTLFAIYNDPENTCAVPEKIAKVQYLACTGYSYDTYKKKDPFCSCVANTVAKEFVEHPVYRKRMIIHSRAEKTCREKIRNN